jgi:hypothetical protein
MARVLPIAPTLASVDALAATLKRYAADLPADQLPSLLGALEATRARAWIRLAAAEHATQDTPTDTGRLLDAKAMAARLQVPESWLREHARGGRVPCVYVGRYMRFDPESVRRALDAEGAAVSSTARKRLG